MSKKLIIIGFCFVLMLSCKNKQIAGYYQKVYSNDKIILSQDSFFYHNTSGCLSFNETIGKWRLEKNRILIEPIAENDISSYQHLIYCLTIDSSLGGKFIMEIDSTFYYEMILKYNKIKIPSHKTIQYIDSIDSVEVFIQNFRFKLPVAKNYQYRVFGTNSFTWNYSEDTVSKFNIKKDKVSVKFYKSTTIYKKVKLF